MDIVLNEQFHRVETALDTLIESISSYNPSPSAALDLVSADDELSKGLEKLSTHQTNHHTILALRSHALTLDAQLKSHLSVLASTRRDLTSRPTTTLPSSARPIRLQELLSYANRISRFTAPPGFKVAPPHPSGDPSTQQANGTAAPSPSGAVEGTPAEGKEGGEDDLNRALHSLTPQEREWLDSVSRAPFVPWPSDSQMREGALADIQIMLEGGRDPSSVLSKEEQEAERKREEEELERRKTEREEEEERQRMGVAAFGGTRDAPKVFRGSDLLDDLDI
ncbi:hypothetical protein M501DRAFT_1019615 [Patellaria atrata CBS 101060]|uniref:Mediator of RNA polymerase II transcription subunit 4 n=1 Tax=Patellaria atrata CBS 101060 TaxID=1346257 RepID=A0A9P4VPL5_9PEZI|nr:hypothetical protein M501DRAFT_1019615 [Patellaria atrata CBS 101060]